MNESASIYVYLLNTHTYPLEQIYYIFYKLNPFDRQRSIAFLKENDRLRFLGGRYLLQKYLHECSVPETLNQIQYDAYKRPKLKHTSFSISHSKNWVVLAAGSYDLTMGIDLEVNVPLHIPDYLEPFCEDERNFILKNNAQSRFYHAWTKKESALKAIGKGFLHNALDINTKMDHFVYENNKYKWKNLDIASDVVSHICHDQHEITLCIKKMPDQL